MKKDNITEREFLLNHINAYFNTGTFQTDLEALTPRQRIEVISKLLSFVMPRLKAVEMDMNATTQSATPTPSLMSLLFPES